MRSLYKQERNTGTEKVERVEGTFVKVIVCGFLAITGANFTVNHELGTLTWQNEIDIAPETLYSEATGSPLPDWVEADEDSANPSIQRTAW
jgi:hypothetical protein